MGRKIFVSYKYADSNVQFMWGTNYPTTVRDYVTAFQAMVDKKRGAGHINKGERDNEDLSMLSETTIWSKLRDKIYDSSVTVVFISPNMKENYKPEDEQWIPQEIRYSLYETTRDDRTSHANGIVAVVLPDAGGRYDYYSYMSNFGILTKNINNRYIRCVRWDYFTVYWENLIEEAINKSRNIQIYGVSKVI